MAAVATKEAVPSTYFCGDDKNKMYDVSIQQKP